MTVYGIADKSAMQRTVCGHKKVAKNNPFLRTSAERLQSTFFMKCTLDENDSSICRHFFNEERVLRKKFRYANERCISDRPRNVSK